MKVTDYLTEKEYNCLVKLADKFQFKSRVYVKGNLLCVNMEKDGFKVDETLCKLGIQNNRDAHTNWIESWVRDINNQFVQKDMILSDIKDNNPNYDIENSTYYVSEQVYRKSLLEKHIMIGRYLINFVEKEDYLLTDIGVTVKKHI